MQVLQDVAKSDVTHLIQSIWQQAGTPQNPVDWSELNKWIAERLSGENTGLDEVGIKAPEKAIELKAYFKDVISDG